MKIPLCYYLLLAVFFLLSAEDGIAQGSVERQIQIETRFIEIRQESSRELGFDWLLDGAAVLDSSAGLFQTDGGQILLDTDLFDRPIVVDSLGAGSAGLPGPEVIAASGILSDQQLSEMIRAMGQMQRSDLLSAPTVVTRSGERARIEVIREFIYPTEFDAPEVPVDPVRFRDDGIRLNITPTIVGDTISLDVAAGTFFRPNEFVVDIFGGGAFGDMFYIDVDEITEQQTRVVREVSYENRVVGTERVQVGTRQVETGTQMVPNGGGGYNIVPVYSDVPVYEDVPVIRRVRVVNEREETITKTRIEENKRGVFEDDPALLGIRATNFIGDYFGVGLEGQYIFGDIHGATTAQLQALLRYPIEFESFAFAPYLLAGAGGIFSADDYATVSLGGGLEFRSSPNLGLFTEVTETWADDMHYPSVKAGVRIVLGGSGMRRTVRTFPQIRDGQTVVLGGILEDTATERAGKIPLLGDLPLLGRLFRGDSSKPEKRNLMMFIKAHLVDPDSE